MGEVIGKGIRKDEPFPIIKQRGLYFYICTDHLDQLLKINSMCKNPLEKVKIVGGRGIAGYRPFLLKGRKGRYLCILAEHLNELKNTAYKEQLEAEKVIVDTRGAALKEAKELSTEAETEAPRIKEGKYVYCVIPSDGKKKSFGNIGFDGEEVYTIKYKDFEAVVSDSPVKEYELTSENMDVHKNVAAQVLEDHSVLPVAYNMVFKNKKILLFAMSKARKGMRRAVSVVDKKVELGLKIALPKDTNPSKDLKNEIESKFFKDLSKIAAESKKLRLFSDRLILNAAFLLDRDKVEEFSKMIEKLDFKDNSLKIQYSGPWPPYNFVDIRILSRRRR
ncbi:MAG: GvpL/GvpF family gas vesicle protein [Methanobacterium sp.]|jgi:hypothetical protein